MQFSSKTITFKMAYSCCFSLWGNLDFLDSFKKCFIILTSDKKGRRFPTQSNPPLTQLANPFFVFKIAKKFQIKNLREKGVGATKLLILDLQQCDQIRRFTNVAQMFGDFLGSCENHRILSQTVEATFWATLGEKLGYFLFQRLVTLLEIYG